jgi:hypothetical protein
VQQELTGVPRHGPRALPDAARVQECAFADVVLESLDGSVRPPDATADTVGDWTFMTPEAQLDALLGASRCRSLGNIDEVPLARLQGLVDILPRVAMHSHAKSGGTIGRAWSVRTWAFGHELLAASPRRLGVVGVELAELGAKGVAASLTDAPIDDEAAVDVSLVVSALMQRAPDPVGVLGAIGAETMDRGLTAAVAYTDDGKVLASQVEAAAAWWRQLADATLQAGVDLPVVPQAVAPADQKVLDLLVDPVGLDVAQALRRLARARRVVRALNTARSGAPEGGCSAPWVGDAPMDPVSGQAFGWESERCTLTLDGTRWPLGGRVGD